MAVKIMGRMDWLYGLQMNGIKLGLDNISELLRRMGDPQTAFPCIHVAGSDGKGSTAAAMASILKASGLKVGLYTSPHILDFRERIKVDGEPISAKDLDHILGKVRHFAEDLRESGIQCTFFEASTAAAFEHFRNAAVDIAVVEVGMGGRLDATNVITPLVSVITGISMEHTQYLGNSISGIAGEKAGIIKPGVPVVTYNTGEALEVIRARCDELNSPLHLLDPSSVTDVRLGRKGTRFRFGGREWFVSVPGSYEALDAQTAMTALKVCRPETEPFFEKGLGQVNWPCRMQEFPDSIVVDVSHTSAGLAGLVRDFSEVYGRPVIVFGMLQDKNVPEACKILQQMADGVVVTAPRTERANPAEDTLAHMKEHIPGAESAPTVQDAIELALASRKEGQTVLVTGSFHMAQEALEWLRTEL